MNIRRLLTASALAVACVVATAGPAHAGIIDMDDYSWTTDRFENDPASRWTIWSNGNGWGGFGDPAGWGYIAHTQTTGWTDIGRDVELPVDGSSECQAFIHMFADNNGYRISARVEVIDPETWTYLAEDGGGVASTPIEHFTPKWKNGPKKVRFRVSLFGNGPQILWLDNMVIHCVY